MSDIAIMGGPHDFDFLIGRWTVRHRMRKAWLAGSDEWVEGEGESVNRHILGGHGIVEDNVIAMPGRTRRALAIRAFDPGTRSWSIWWLDPRYPEMGSPVRGGFSGEIGVFTGVDHLAGRPVEVRFIWTRAEGRARWEQAYSADGGAHWETNWTMDFTRATA